MQEALSGGSHIAHNETFNEQAQNGPQILELLSELEKRDKASKGASHPGITIGVGIGDPRGFTVQNATGHDVGKVTDLYVDPHTRVPQFALLSLGGHTLGIGNRNILVGYSDIEIVNAKKVRVRATLSAEYISVIEAVTIVGE